VLPRRRRWVRTSRSAVQARLCSDASQALRRKEQKRKVEEAEVRPDCVVCCASVTNSDALQALRHEERKRKVEEEKVRPVCVVCCAGATMF
jgi:hypothetical protein